VFLQVQIAEMWSGMSGIEAATCAADNTVAEAGAGVFYFRVFAEFDV
jgi:hypothetical protein